MLKVRWYEKHYVCPRCATEWTDEWSCLCNDRCPTCDLEISPISWEDKCRFLLREDYEEAAKEARSSRADRAPTDAGNVTAEMARDYAEARLEGR
jgi:hypothetical protein